MPLEDLKDEELKDLEKKGLESLSDEALQRLEGHSKPKQNPGDYSILAPKMHQGAWTPEQAANRRQVIGEVLTAPSRYARAGMVGLEQLASPENLAHPIARGIEAITEGTGSATAAKAAEAVERAKDPNYQPRSGEEAGAFIGNLAGQGAELLGYGALAPEFGGARYASTIGKIGARALHGAMTMGAQGAAEAASQGQNSHNIAEHAAASAALGTSLGAAGAIPGLMAARYPASLDAGEALQNLARGILPKGIVGAISRDIIPRMTGAAAEAGIGAGFGMAQGDLDPWHAVKNAGMYALLGILGNKDYEAQHPDLIKSATSEAVKAQTDNGADPAEAQAKAEGALKEALAEKTLHSSGLEQHPDFGRFLDEQVVEFRKHNPGVTPEEARELVRQHAAKMHLAGDLGPSLAAMKPLPGAEEGVKGPQMTAPPKDSLPAATPEVPPAVQEAMEKTGLKIPELAPLLAAPPEGQVPESKFSVPEAISAAPEGDAQEPAEGGDISFMEPSKEAYHAPATPEELVQAEIDATTQDLSREGLGRRFPGAPPEVLDRLERRVREEQAEHLKRQDSELLKGERFPLSRLVRQHGGFDASSDTGEFRDQDMIGRSRAFPKEGGRLKMDAIRELAETHGLIPPDQVGDTVSAIERARQMLIDEFKASTKGGASTVAEPTTPYTTFKPAKIKEPLKPEEVIRTAEAAGVKPGAVVPLLRNFKDPVFGKIDKDTPATVIAIDSENGSVLVEHSGSAEKPLLSPDVAILPIEAVAKPVRNAPPEEPSAGQVKKDVQSATGLKKPEEASVRESVAFKEGLRQAVRAAREGYEAAQAKANIAARAMRDAFNQKIGSLFGEVAHLKAEARVSEKWQAAVRSNISAYVKGSLPPEERGTFIGPLAKARTISDMLEIHRAVDERVLDYHNRKTVEDINTVLSRIMDAKGFPHDIKNQVKAFMDVYRKENWNETTIDKLQSLQEFIDHVRATGDDVSIPQAIVERLGKLAKRPLKSLEPAELDGVLSTLHLLEIKGIEAREVMAVLRDEDIQRTLADMTGNPTAVFTQKPSTTKRAENLKNVDDMGFSDQHVSMWNRISDWFQSVGHYLQPARGILSHFDGRMMGLDAPGPNDQLADTIQDAESGKMRWVSKGVDVIEEAAKKLGRMPTPKERHMMSLWAFKEMDPEILRTHFGFDDAKIGAVDLPKDLKDFAVAVRDYISSPEAINRLARAKELRGLPDPFVKVDKYWPMMMNFDVTPRDAMPIDIFKDEFDMRQYNPRGKMLLTRKPGTTQALKSDFLAVALDHMNSSATLQFMSEPLTRAHEITTHPEYVKKYGDAAADFWKDYIDTQARSGRVPGSKRIAVLDWMRRNLTISTLGWKPDTALVHLSAKGNMAAVVGGRLMSEATLAGKEWGDFVEQNMPLIEARGKERDLRNLLEGSLMPKIDKNAMAGINSISNYTARDGAIAAYWQYLEQHGIERDLAKPVPEGLIYAQKMVGMTQQSDWLTQAPLGMTRGGSIAKMFLQFKGPQLARWGLVKEAIANAGEHPAETAQRLGWLASSIAFERGVRIGWKGIAGAILVGIGAMKQDKYDEAMKKDMSIQRNVLMGALNANPITGALADAVAYRSSPVPAFNAMGEILDDGRSLADATFNTKAGEIRLRPIAAVKALGDALRLAAEAFVGVPGLGVAGSLAHMALKDVKDEKPLKPGQRPSLPGRHRAARKR